MTTLWQHCHDDRTTLQHCYSVVITVPQRVLLELGCLQSAARLSHPISKSSQRRLPVFERSSASCRHSCYTMVGIVPIRVTGSEIYGCWHQHVATQMAIKLTTVDHPHSLDHRWDCQNVVLILRWSISEGAFNFEVVLKQGFSVYKTTNPISSSYWMESSGEWKILQESEGRVCAMLHSPFTIHHSPPQTSI